MKNSFCVPTRRENHGSPAFHLSGSGVLWRMRGGMPQICTLLWGQRLEWISRFRSFLFVRGITGAKGAVWIASLGHPRGFVLGLSNQVHVGAWGRELLQQLIEKKDIYSHSILLLRGAGGYLLKHLGVFQMGRQPWDHKLHSQATPRNLTLSPVRQYFFLPNKYLPYTYWVPVLSVFMN